MSLSINSHIPPHAYHELFVWVEGDTPFLIENELQLNARLQPFISRPDFGNGSSIRIYCVATVKVGDLVSAQSDPISRQITVKTEKIATDAPPPPVLTDMPFTIKIIGELNGERYTSELTA